MASLDEYMIKMCDWQQQFNLPIAILPLFNALHQKMHGGSPNRLIRMMQCSTQKQKLIADVLFELTTVALKRCEPTTARNCIEMIQGCAEILKAARKSSHFDPHYPYLIHRPSISWPHHHLRVCLSLVTAVGDEQGPNFGTAISQTRLYCV